MYNNQSASIARQQGAAMIAVLIIMMVVTVLGVAAMRMGITGLTLATNSQISNLLFEAADTGMNNMEQAINPTNAAVAMDVGGILSTRETDVPYCVVPLTTNPRGLTPGACNNGSATSMFSSRGVSMVQVNYRRAPDSGIESNSAQATLLNYGSAGGKGLVPDRLTVTSTAVMVNIGSATPATINACLSGNPGDDTLNPAVTTITDCLTDAGAIFTTHMDEYILGF